MKISQNTIYEDSNKRCFIEVDVKYPEELHEIHIDLLFLQGRMKI